MLASIRTTGTVFLRQLELHLRLQPRNTFMRGQVFLAGGENSAPGTLRLHATLMELIRLAVLLHQFVMVLVRVFDNGVELFARQARHGPVDEVEIVSTVKVI